MKTCLLLFGLLLLFTLSGGAQDKEKIKEAVYRWNSLHNTKQNDQFKNIYAPRVLFYGRYNSRKKCYEKKNRFLSPDFSQEIITPLSLTVYSSGTVKCDFTKRVTYKNIVKQHECYLLLEEQGGSYLITGESDLVIDKKLAVQLHLGNVLPDEVRPFSPAIIITIITVLVLLLLFILYKRREGRAAGSLEERYNPEPAVAGPELFDTNARTKHQPFLRTNGHLQGRKEPNNGSKPITELLSGKDKGDAF